MNGFFEHMAAFDDSEREQERTATAVANRRAESRFGAFVRSAVDANDRGARLDLIEDELRQVVADVVSEYGGDPSRIEASLRDKFAMDPYGPMGQASTPVPPPVPQEGAVATPGPGGVAPGMEGSGSGLHPCAQGHPDCAATPGGACSQRVQEPDAPGLGGFGQPMGGQAPMYSSHQAAGEDGPITPLFGDRAPETQHHPDPEQKFESIDQELADAPSAVGHGVLASDSTGLADSPSGPKLDKKLWKGLKPIDTDGGRYKTETHDVSDTPEYNHGDGDGSWRADSPVEKFEDLPSNKEDAGFQSGGQEHGDHTDTWSGKKDQANPVTKEKQAGSADVDKNPLREIIESEFNGFMPQNTVQQAIAAYKKGK